MTARGHLPAFEGGQLLGLVAIGGEVSALLSDRQDLIDQLSAYIAGKA
jgi:hypothetical protein